MLRRWLVTVLAACGSSSTTPATENRAAMPADSAAVVEGRIIDSKTRAGIPGVEVMFDGPCRHGEEVLSSLTDENGHYRAELEPGVCGFMASLEGLASTSRDKVEVRRRSVAVVDAELEHGAVLAARRERPPANCPHSPPGAVIEGHSTSQEDIDALARAVLERFALDAGTMPDGGLLPEGDVPVNVELGGTQKRRLTATSFPPTTKPRFVPRPMSDLQGEADRADRNVFYIAFHDVYSDGDCAVLWAGVYVAIPRRSRGITMCCCSGNDLWERHAGQWQFVRRLAEPCI